MSERKIDREAWAALIATLVMSETRGKKAAFSRLIGVSTRTLDRWLAAEVDVSEGSVRTVARALSRPPAELLVRIGYYSHEEIGPTPNGRELVIPPEVRHILQALADPDIPDDEKSALRIVLQMAAARARAARERVESPEAHPNG